MRAVWSAEPGDDYQGGLFTYWNFKLGRAEWGLGRIPAQYLDDYMPQKEQQ